MASIFFRLLKENAKGVALRTPKKQEPKELILTIPAGPSDTVKQLGKEANRVICLSTLRLFRAVGAFWGVFDQAPDEEVKRLLGVL
jgi:putative phosphoribosyl transferase